MAYTGDNMKVHAKLTKGNMQHLCPNHLEQLCVQMCAKHEDQLCLLLYPHTASTFRDHGCGGHWGLMAVQPPQVQRWF
jgi:hypothetical protein